MRRASRADSAAGRASRDTQPPCLRVADPCLPVHPGIRGDLDGFLQVCARHRVHLVLRLRPEDERLCADRGRDVLLEKRARPVLAGARRPLPPRCRHPAATKLLRMLATLPRPAESGAPPPPRVPAAASGAPRSAAVVAARSSVVGDGRVGLRSPESARMTSLLDEIFGVLVLRFRCSVPATRRRDRVVDGRPEQGVGEPHDVVPRRP